MDKMFSSNNTVKLLALVLAIVLWLYVTQADQQSRPTVEVTKPYYMVTIVPQNVPSGLMLTQIPTQLESITLRGLPHALALVTPAELVATVNLAGLDEGVHEVQVNVRVPSGVRVAGVTPSRVQVKLDAVVARQTGVHIELLGEPGRGLVTETPTVRPSQVFIDGPRSMVDQVALVVARISVNEATYPLTESLPLKAVDSEGKEVLGVNISPAVVDVVVPIGLPSKEVPIKPVIEGQPAEGYLLSGVQLEPSTVRVVAPQDVLDTLEYIPTEAVDITDAVEDISAELILRLLDPVKLSETSPARVSVRVRIQLQDEVQPDGNGQ